MEYWKSIRFLFVLVQISLTIYFIWYSVDNWEQSPSVTSIEVKKLSYESFPAVSMCLETTSWKWPGLINLASQWNTPSKDDLKSMKWVEHILRHLADITTIKMNAEYWEYNNLTGGSMDVCNAIKTLFTDPEDTEIKEFLLGFYHYIEKVVEESEVSDLLWQINYYSSDDLKNYFCHDKKSINCTSLKPDQCVPFTRGSKASAMSRLCYQWTYMRYFNAKTFLKILHQYAFNGGNQKHLDVFLLFLNAHELSKMNNTDIYSQWYYLTGLYVKGKGHTIERYLTKNGGLDLGMTKTICTNQENCQDVENYFQTLDQKDFQMLKELLDQPKAHSNNRDDFILAPFCSFNNEQLKKCDFFEKTKVTYLDHTCYTYDRVNYAEPFPPYGLNLLLNLKRMPTEQELSVKLLFHEQGTMPDVYQTESVFQKVAETGKIQIGLDVRTTEFTENFAKMSYRKRQCLLPGERENYRRTECLVNQIHEYAKGKCKCLPILMANMVGQNNNVECSQCFRSAIREAKLFLNESLCPALCSDRQFKPFVTRQPWWYSIDGEYGDDVELWLMAHPLGLYLDKISWDINIPAGKGEYLKILGEKYSLVQIFFGTPQKTVITKDAKVTETDMVSNIGGTIGIFLGLSTISVLDMIMEWFTIFQAKGNKVKIKRKHSVGDQSHNLKQTKWNIEKE